MTSLPKSAAIFTIPAGIPDDDMDLCIAILLELVSVISSVVDGQFLSRQSSWMVSMCASFLSRGKSHSAGGKNRVCFVLGFFFFGGGGGGGVFL